MSSEQEIAVVPGRRRFAAGKLLLALTCLLLAVLVGLWAGWQRYSAQLVEEQIAALRAAGEPVTPADLERYYRLPEGREDCTALYLAACQPLEGATFVADCGTLPIVGNNPNDPPLPPQTWSELAAVEAFLEKYRPSLVQLHDAARRGGAARYPTDFGGVDGGTELLIADIQRLRSTARILQLEALVGAHRGEPSQAAEAMHTRWLLGESLAYVPNTISQLVRIAIDSTVTGQLEDLLPVVDFSDADLRTLQADFRGWDARESLGRSCRGELVYGLHSIDQPGEDIWNSAAWPRRFLPHVERGYWLDHMTKVIAAADARPPDSREKLRVLEQQAADVGNGSFVSQLGKTTVAGGSPMSAAVADAAYRSAAVTAAANAAVAAELFRRREGRWPESIAELVPEFLSAVPDDPFDGLPLRMVLRGDELSIYSIGRNGRDDGGTWSADTLDWSDVGFRVRRVPLPDKSD